MPLGLALGKNGAQATKINRNFETERGSPWPGGYGAQNGMRLRSSPHPCVCVCCARGGSQGQVFPKLYVASCRIPSKKNISIMDIGWHFFSLGFSAKLRSPSEGWRSLVVAICRGRGRVEGRMRRHDRSAPPQKKHTLNTRVVLGVVESKRV